MPTITDDTLKLYWRAIWGTAKNIEAQDGIVMSNDRMERLMSETHAAGGKAHAQESERRGIEIFGRVIREKIAEWPKPEDGDHMAHTVPVWDLERLLDDYNIPPLPESETTSD